MNNKMKVENYQVGWICALPTEMAAAVCMLDERHEMLPLPATDDNNYALGKIGPHNVVIACLPAGVTGVTSAARVAERMRATFTALRFGLMVGIGGGAPSDQHDIRLGDVVVSKPSDTSGGVIQYDFGKTVQQGRFVRTGSLNRPPNVLLSAVNSLQAQHMIKEPQLSKFIADSVTRFPLRQEACIYPGSGSDRLYHWKYDHPEEELTCCRCDSRELINRHTRPADFPRVHYGLIASGNQAMRDGKTRERLRKELNVLCFEMEAAGLMDSFPCLVVRGICDYADTHKNKQWQDYASMTAAAYTKELLKIMPRQEVESQMKLIDVVEVSRLEEFINIRGESMEMDLQSKIMDRLSMVNFWGSQVDIYARAHEGTSRWILEEEKFKSWLAGPPCLLLCQGDPGVGKTVLSSIIIEHLCSTVRSKAIGVAWLYIDYRENDSQTMENLFANLLVQLFNIRGEISQLVKNSLGFKWEGAKPTSREYKFWLQEEVRKFGEMIIIIDALDELPSRGFCKQFINELQSLEPPIRLLLTSRPNPNFGFSRSASIEIDIHPRKDDVIRYVEGRLQSSGRLWDHIVEEPSLRELTIEKLTGANDRMFLRAQLILNILEHLKSAEDMRKALTTLPSTYDGCYDFTLKQIEMKDPTQRNTAFKVLAWLSHALGNMTVEALQDALSMQSRDGSMTEKRQIPVEDLLSSCSGLAITETVNGSKNIRLLHETARGFLMNFRSSGFPYGHELILETCLAYLSLPEFSDLCIFKTAAEARAKQYPLFEYAARYWSAHILQGNLESTFQGKIITFLESLQRHSADEFLSSGLRSAWGCDYATPWTDWNRHSISRRDTPIHAAATYGLRKTLSYLIKEKGYAKDRRNNFGETPLHRTAQVGRSEAMEELIACGADLDARVHQHYLNQATPLILATICLQSEAIRVLLNHGVDVNAFDPIYKTVPLHLAASMDTNLTRLLLDHGANVNFPGKSPVFPETLPMTSLHFAVFNAHAFQGALDRIRLLLDRGAAINAKSSVGNTALHMAIIAGHQELANYLLCRGSDISLTNQRQKSVVQLARECGRLHWIEEAVPNKIPTITRAGPPLHRAVWSKNHSLVRELLESGHNIAEPDHEGVTPWEYCISSSNVELAQILVDFMNNDNYRQASFSQVGNAAFDVALSHMTAFDYTDHHSWESIVQIATLLLPFRRIHDPDFHFARVESPIGEYKKTYLIWAAELGRILQVRFLLQCGSDVNAQDRFGSTGLHYAVNNQDIDMVRVLVEEGRCDVTIAARGGVTAQIAAEKTGNIPLRDYLLASKSGQSQQDLREI